MEQMAQHTTFGIGGPADVFIEIASADELGAVLGFLESEGIPKFILGGGANILVGDKGVRGAVLDLTGMSWARLSGHNLIAGAGISVDRLSENALAFELEGLENFYGLPGSLGGALFMNARCYEKDFSELVEEVLAFSPSGQARIIHPRSDQWAYKSSPFQPGEEWAGWIIANATLKFKDGKAEHIARIMRARKLDRISKGHYRMPSAGSMFKNNRAFGKPTGLILDGLGLKGIKIGGAAISPWHANIFINEGNATAKDMRTLISLVQEKAFSAYKYKLEPEVLFVGEF